MSSRRLRLLSFAWLGVLLPVVGCSGFFVYPGSTTGGGSTTGTDFVYVANATTQTLSGFALASGALTAVANSPYGLGFQPSSLAINPANTILYVAGNSQIYAYSIGSSGALTTLNNGSPVMIANVVSMDISPDGQWLFALDGNGVSLDEYQINATTGVLTQVSGAAYSVAKAVVVPRAVKVSPNGAFVFAALGTAGDLVFTLNRIDRSGLRVAATLPGVHDDQRQCPCCRSIGHVSLHREERHERRSRCLYDRGQYGFARGRHGFAVCCGQPALRRGVEPGWHGRVCRQSRRQYDHGIQRGGRGRSDRVDGLPIYLRNCRDGTGERSERKVPTRGCKWRVARPDAVLFRLCGGRQT